MGIVFVIRSTFGFERIQTQSAQLQSIPVFTMFIFDIVLFLLFIAYMNNNILYK